MTQDIYPYKKPKKFDIQAFFQKHRTLTIIILFILCGFFLVLMYFSIFGTPENEKREPEDPPYITMEENKLIEVPFINSDTLYHLKLILLDLDELSSAPNTNPNGNNYLVSITNKANNQPGVDDSIVFYTMNVDVSDGRHYVLKILLSLEYNNEYAVVVLDRTDRSDKDYVITFTSNTSEYYSTLGTSDASSASNSSPIKDYITGAPLQPIPEYAEDWINSLKLTTPETLHTTLPSIR